VLNNIIQSKHIPNNGLTHLSRRSPTVGHVSLHCYA